MGISLPTNLTWLLVGGKPYTLGHQGQTLVQSLIFTVTQSGLFPQPLGHKQCWVVKERLLWP